MLEFSPMTKAKISQLIKKLPKVSHTGNNVSHAKTGLSVNLNTFACSDSGFKWRKEN